MPSQPHMVERLSLSIDMPDLDSALRLRARAEELAHQHLPRVIERVFDTLDVPDMRIELERLDLDLGTIPAGRLEDDAPAALERALTEALTDALRHVHQTASPGRRAVSVPAAALKDFDAYLVHGSRQFHGEDGFDPAHAFRRLLDTQPDALVSMLRRRAHDRHALDRLVLQLPEACLHTLLAVLVPGDAALVLAYQAELHRRYRSKPAPISEPALRHTTWVLTLEFLLREPGTQFNRRAYAAHLLRGVAAEQGIAYSALLRLIRDALTRTRQRRPVAESLPGVLDELIAENESAGDETAPRAAAHVRHGAGETLLQRFQSAGDPATLEALTQQLSAPQFITLIEQLEPTHAAVILACVAGLTTLDRQAPLVALSHDGFERRLRLIVLSDLLREAAPRFNRRGWLRLVLRRLAAAGGVSHAFLLESLTAALAALRHQPPLESALRAAVAELTADLPISDETPSANELDVPDITIARLRRHRADEPALTTLIRGMTPETFKAVVERLQPRHARQLLDDIAALTTLQHRHMLVALSAAAFDLHLRLIASRWLLRDAPPPFRRSVWMGYLSNGLANAARIDPGRVLALVANRRDSNAIGTLRRDPAALAREIERDARARTELLRSLAQDPALLLRVAGAMSESAMMTALTSFGAAGADVDLTLLADRHAEVPLADLDGEAFRRLTWTIAIIALASGERFRRDGLRRRLLEGIARHQGLSAFEIGNWRQIERRSPPPYPSDTIPSDPLMRAEHFLRSGSPSAYAPGLVHVAAKDPAGFAALLRRLTVAASGATESLIERLLEWMLPEEIAAALLPDAADRAAAWASHLADMPGGTMTAAWTRVLDTALRGAALDASDPPAPGERHDRLALLRHWLEHGTLPWWAPPTTRVEHLLAHLAVSPTPELQQLFDDADAETVAVRLRRAIQRLGAARGAILIERLAPWTFATDGPFATLSADLAGDALDAARVRAAAAAIVGVPIDGRRLARPLPEPEAEAEPEQTPVQAPADRVALFDWLSGKGPENPPRLASWLRLLAELADRSDPSLDAALRGALVRPEARARWVVAMPAEIFARVVHRLVQARARFLLDAAAIVAAAWRGAVPSAASGTARAALSTSLLAMLAKGDPVLPRTAIGRLIKSLPAGPSEIAIRTRAAELARSGGYANVAAMLNVPPGKKPSRPAETRTRDAVRLPQPELGDHLYIANAGLVLLNPYLPLFFERIGVLTPDAQGVPRIAGIEAASRAVHLLQYLADTRCDAPEPDLALNKLLAGVPIAAPIARAIELTEADRALCDQLIQAIIANWTVIRNTSPAGLRETFLQREGRLRREADRWTLDVQRKTVDVLVDQIPWSRTLVYHRWMAEPVHVNW